MTVEETYIKGCYVITPKVFEDERGYFLESFNKNGFEKHTGLSIDFVQDNESKSSKGVLRGLHIQTGQYEQAKLVRVTKGKVMDVCVDLRSNSETFGKYFSIMLDDVHKQQLFIPKGFAHGFLVLEDNTIFNYKCDQFYNKASERGVIYNDTTLNIDWGWPDDQLIISEKDMNLPGFEAFCRNEGIE
ncbi:dTDP-4-dehydrorhamnose 3,5-epimerase [Aestuariivivens sediminicola]|uniref:dTDP-4-dehydrorhamnose 3,5-epimerase n=1 Tax=Aestuariivivens sediminicola TaxID=2913560 RepID=UPI001F591286|nr:dTDP-4-dehydrorhamnose 3,5-epimerase [Aestuariivivens sediminicola]